MGQRVHDIFGGAWQSKATAPLLFRSTAFSAFERTLPTLGWSCYRPGADAGSRIAVFRAVFIWLSHNALPVGINIERAIS